jgi:hypothetical protein
MWLKIELFEQENVKDTWGPLGLGGDKKGAKRMER